MCPTAWNGEEEGKTAVSRNEIPRRPQKGTAALGEKSATSGSDVGGGQRSRPPDGLLWRGDGQPAGSVSHSADLTPALPLTYISRCRHLIRRGSRRWAARTAALPWPALGEAPLAMRRPAGSQQQRLPSFLWSHSREAGAHLNRHLLPCSSASAPARRIPGRQSERRWGRGSALVFFRRRSFPRLPGCPALRCATRDPRRALGLYPRPSAKPRRSSGDCDLEIAEALKFYFFVPFFLFYSFYH